MCPRYILSNNGTEFKNQLLPHTIHRAMETRGILQIPKPILKKLCDSDQDNWDQYFNQVLISYCVTPCLITGETAFFLIYGKDPNLPLQQLLESMQCFFGDPDTGCLNWKMHCLALSIAMKTLSENRFKKYTEDNRSSSTWLSSQRQSLL